MSQQQLFDKQNGRLEVRVALNVVSDELNRFGKRGFMVRKSEVDFYAVFICDGIGEREFVHFD